MSNNEHQHHLKESISDRGFTRLPEIEGIYGGNILVHESSSAMSPCLWLRVSDSTTDDEIVAVHLEADDAWKLAEQLMLSVKNHYQGDARPESIERYADILNR